MDVLPSQGAPVPMVCIPPTTQLDRPAVQQIDNTTIPQTNEDLDLQLKRTNRQPSVDEAQQEQEAPKNTLSPSLLKNVPLELWRDMIIGRFFSNTQDWTVRKCLFQLVRVSKDMFQASAPVLYKTIPIRGLKYATTKKIFTESVLKSVQEKRIAANRTYSLYVRDLDWTNACAQFLEKHMIDPNLHRITSACGNVERVVVPSTPQPYKMTDRTLHSISRVRKTGAGHLHKLRIENVNCFTVGGLAHLFASTQLRVFECHSRYTNTVTGTQIMAVLVKNKVQLTDLVLVECPVDDMDVVGAFLLHNTGLLRLEVHSVPIHSRMLTYVPGLVALRHLTIHTEEIVGDNAKHILATQVFPNIKHLLTLYLHGFPVTDECLKSIGDLQLNLRSLTLSNAELSDPRVVCDVIVKSPKLKWVDVSGNTGLRQNPVWVEGFPKHSCEAEDDEPWWMEDNEEITFGNSMLVQIRSHYKGTVTGCV